MRHLFVIVSLSLLVFNISFAQTATVKGVIKDGGNGELLENATVLQPPTNGTASDIRGAYELKVNPGSVTLVISYLGMKADTQTFNIKAGEVKTLNVNLGGNANELMQVVIGENRIGTKVQKTTQSVDVMKPRMLETNNITNMQNAVTKIPGVTVLDGQMSIRGGSGYAYGSGSRVTLVIDEMPMMAMPR